MAPEITIDSVPTASAIVFRLESTPIKISKDEISDAVSCIDNFHIKLIKALDFRNSFKVLLPISD